MLKPKAQYNLNLKQRRAICELVNRLKLPDRYAFNLSWCVDLKEYRMHGIKNHDYHVFMHHLLSISFVALPKFV